MRITILGSGSAYGCPMCFNQWNLADPHNPKNERTRACVLFEIQGKNFLIDVGPDFRQQINRHQVQNIDAVLLTHCHYDHIGGVPELPRACKILNHVLPVFASAETMSELQKSYAYLFSGAEPDSVRLQWNILPDFGKVNIGGVEFETFCVPHHNLHSSAFRFGDVAYVTDWESLPPKALERMQGLKMLLAECNNGEYELNNGHSNIAKIKHYVNILKPEQVVLTHLSARVDYNTLSALVPENWRLAYDGMDLLI